MPDEKQQISALVTQLQGGDGKAFEKLYNLTCKSAYFTALKIVKNEDDAEDVLQNAYVKVLEKIKALDKPESFSSWFNMIVANEAKTLLRKNKPGIFTDNVISGGRDGEEEFSVFDTIKDDREEYTPGAGVEKDELQRDVMELIDNLDDEKRTAVLLYYYNEMTTKQIAESLDISEGTVKTRLYYARKQLAEGVAELEKKNGKLLGVAPIPLVIWALKASSGTATAAFIASGASAAVLTAITEAAVSAGSAAAVTGGVITGLTVVQKIVITVVTVGVVAGGSVGAKAIVKNHREKKNEETSITEVTELSEETSYEGVAYGTDETYNSDSVQDDELSEDLSENLPAEVSAEVGENTTAIPKTSETSSKSETTVKVTTKNAVTEKTTVKKTTARSTTRRTTTKRATTTHITSAASAIETTKTVVIAATTKQTTTETTTKATTKATTTESTTKGKATINIKVYLNDVYQKTIKITVDDGSNLNDSVVNAVTSSGYDDYSVSVEGDGLPDYVIGGKSYDADAYLFKP